jgi:hypothetical protein
LIVRRKRGHGDNKDPFKFLVQFLIMPSHTGISPFDFLKN